jgi:SAM-dependent methyltransferase
METTEPVRYHWDQDGYYQEYHNRMRMIATVLEQAQVDSVLDLGCGHGKMRHLLPKEIPYYGCDGHWDKPPYDDAPYAEWIFRGDAPELPFDDKAFGAITCSGLIEYIAAQTSLFQAIFDRLQPGGYLVCSAINPLFPPFLLGRYKLPKGKWHPAWHQVRPLKAIAEEIRGAGFQLESYMWVPEKQNSEAIAKEAVKSATSLVGNAALPSFRNFSQTQILFVARKPT